jgi:GT2 family glycosyltransferase
LYSPQPAVIHKIGASTNQAPVKTIIRFHRSMARLYRKHLARNAFEWALVSAGVTVRAGLLIASLWLRMAQARVIQAWRGGG